MWAQDEPEWAKAHAAEGRDGMGQNRHDRMGGTAGCVGRWDVRAGWMGGSGGWEQRARRAGGTSNWSRSAARKLESYVAVGQGHIGKPMWNQLGFGRGSQILAKNQRMEIDSL